MENLTDMFQKQVKHLEKLFLGEVMRERNNWPLRIQYMATWHDGTFDVNMTSSEVVCSRHHISRFLCRSLVMKIKPNIGQTLGTMDKRERIKIWLSLRGQILTVILKCFSKSEKSHNGGQTWHIFFLSQRRSKLHDLISLSVKKGVHRYVEEVKIRDFYRGPIN